MRGDTGLAEAVVDETGAALDPVDPRGDETAALPGEVEPEGEDCPTIAK